MKSEGNNRTEAKRGSNFLEQFRELFGDLKSGTRTIDEVKKQISSLINSEVYKKHLPEDFIETALTGLDEAAKLEDKEKFVSFLSKLFSPIMELDPVEIEDAQALTDMKKNGFARLNKRVSYGASGGIAHIHLAQSYEVKDELPSLFADAMKKLAEIVRNDPEIKQVIGTSWIIATKTYGEAFAAMGFTIDEPPAWVKENHFKDETRPIKRASMSREKFLETFGQQDQ